MRLVVLAALALAVAVLACGCGGKADNGLGAYLERVDAEQTHYERERAQVIRALAGVHAVAPDGTWTRAARTLRQAGTVYHRLAERMARIEAPSNLADRHGGLARSLLLYQQIVEAQQAAFARGDTAFLVRTVNATQPLADQAHALRARWRAAAIRAARGAGVDFPPRLRHVGT
jgi:hypothetical protein